MLRLKLQYFMCFAVIGSMLPYFTVFLRDRGMSNIQIGWIMSMTSIAALITPVLVGALADRKIDPRRLLSGVYLLTCLPLLAMAGVDGFWPILLLTAAHCLAIAPITSLQDGMNFSLQRRLELKGKPTVPYHRIRVWGTIGFIIPSVVLYFLLQNGLTTEAILFVTTGFCLLGIFNATTMSRDYVPDAGPDPAAADPQKPDTDNSARPAGDKLPTFAALAMLRQKDVLVMFIAMGLVHMAAACYYSYYPVYLRDSVGIDAKWIGLITQIGVVIEIGFMLGYAKLIQWFGVRALLTFGVACLAIRLVLLASFDSPWVAIGTQGFHGVNVLVFHVLPQVYLNRRAGDTYRNSMQAIFMMLVSGVSRIVGNISMGALAEISLAVAFLAGAGLTVVAVVLILCCFREVHDPPAQPAQAKPPQG